MAKARSEISPATKQSIGRWLFNTIFKLVIVGLFALLIYVIYLDAKVRDKFEGERWQVPIQVYSRAETIAIGDKLSLTLLADVMQRAGYQRVNKVWRPGQFAQSNARIIIFRKAFEETSTEIPQAKLTIDVRNGKIDKLYQDDISQQQLILPPQHIARLVSDDKEDRVLVDLESVPETLLDTLLLVEDRDFYFHRGVSPVGILRALYNNIVAGRTVQGGSTLTQQLVKNMYLTRQKTLVRKINEAIMALLLELRYSKDQLLEAYINEVYLGQHYANGIYGFGLASEFYFGQNIGQLSSAQMALLVGIIKGPSYYDPWRKPERVKKRRDLVLRLMLEHDIIDVATFESAASSNLGIRQSRRLSKQRFYNYLQQVRREMPEILSGYERNAGVKVFTGFSMLSQLLLEDTTKQTLLDLESQHQQQGLQAAALVTDITSGELRAIVGDRNANNNGFNRALDAKRQIGSLIKPAIYLPALEQYQHFNLATVIEDKPMSVTTESGEQWSPKNYDGKFREQVSLIDGLTYSLNVPTVNLGMMLGLTTVLDVMNMLGYDQDVTLRPSILLGAVNMSPFSVNQLYLPIANNGYYQPVHAITHVVSHHGETIWEYQLPAEQRISSHTSFLLNHALTSVTEKGTAKSLSWRLKGSKLAGKTGTTNDQRDSWFVGYDKATLVTTWIGHDDNKPTELTGSSGALVLFANYMKASGVKNIINKMPETVAMVKFENKTGNPVKDNCKGVTRYPAVVGELSYSNCMEKIEDKRPWWKKIFGDG